MLYYAREVAMITIENKNTCKFTQDFAFDAKGLQDAQRFILQTIVDNREEMNLEVRCYFYQKGSSQPHCLMEFIRYPYKIRGVYGGKAKNEAKLMKEMQRWQGEGLPLKSEVVADLYGKNFHIRDFQRFRKALETAGVKFFKSYLNFKVVLK